MCTYDIKLSLFLLHSLFIFCYFLEFETVLLFLCQIQNQYNDGYEKKPTQEYFRCRHTGHDYTYYQENYESSSILKVNSWGSKLKL